MMEPDKLAETLAGLRLTSPPAVTSSNNELKFKVVIHELSNEKIRLYYRIQMNPKDMVANMLIANNFILLASISAVSVVLPVWPNASVPPKTVRISLAVAEMLNVQEGESISWIPWKKPIAPPPTILYVQIIGTSLTEQQKVLLRHTIINEFPCLLPGVTFVIPGILGNDKIRCRFEIKDGSSALCFGLGDNFKKESIRIVEESGERGATASVDHAVSISGLEKVAKIIMDTISMTIKKSEKISKLDVKFPKGILLFGPPGVGKTSLVKMIASRMNLKLLTISGGEVASSRFYGEAESNLRDIFKTAVSSDGALIFIDEIESLCPRRDKTSSSASDWRVVATLLTLLDGMNCNDTGNFFCIAATNNPNSIDNALRRPGRFDMEVEIGVPKFPQRLEILEGLIRASASISNISDECLSLIAEKAHGFVGADLALIVREANMISLSRSKDAAEITETDLMEAFAKVKPSAIREVLLEIPKVRWDEIGGQEETKQKLKESVELPLKNPEIFTKFGIRPPKGILLYGPPGCSKTMMAKAIATESGLNFFTVKGPEIFSKWVGDSEKAIAEIFRKARLASPSVIFFDEFDAVGRKRSDSSSGTSVSDRVLSQLLGEMDGIDPLVSVTVLAATNRPDVIDEALLRPGRFDRHVYISLPDFNAREHILQICSRKVPIDLSVDFKQIAGALERYSGAEISALCQEAVMQAFSENPETSSISMSHFQQAMTLIKPRTSQAMIDFFESYSR